MNADLVATAIKLAVMLGFVLNVVPVMVWVERRGSALIQDRPGPNRVGPLGLLQSFADALKFILKEDLIPAQAHKWLYTLAPTFGLVLFSKRVEALARAADGHATREIEVIEVEVIPDDEAIRLDQLEGLTRRLNKALFRP